MIKEKEKILKAPLGEEEKEKKKRMREEEKRKKKEDAEEEEGIICDEKSVSLLMSCAVFRIHDILVEAGSADPCLCLMDPDPAIFVIDIQDANKKLILNKVFLLMTF
jgi:hypothetical protein